MLPPRRRILLGTLAATLALSVIYLQIRSPKEQQLQLLETLSGEADLHIQNSKITQFGANGKIKYLLISSEIFNFEESGLTLLKTPELTLYQPNGPPWKMQAEIGEIREQKKNNNYTELIILNKDVEIERYHPNGDYLTMKSEQLRLYPEDNYAETDQDVSISSHIGETTAAGLQGEIQVGALSLFSSSTKRVHSIFLPQNIK